MGVRKLCHLLSCAINHVLGHIGPLFGTEIYVGSDTFWRGEKCFENVDNYEGPPINQHLILM